MLGGRRAAVNAFVAGAAASAVGCAGGACYHTGCGHREDAPQRGGGGRMADQGQGVASDGGRQPAAASIDVVVVVASAGGTAAVTRMLSGLPADFPAAVLLVQHMEPKNRHVLESLLPRRTPLRVRLAAAGEPLRRGTVFLSPVGRQILVRPDGRLDLTDTDLIPSVCPSADLLMESVAKVFRRRAGAVILSGKGGDGVKGAGAIQEAGGVVVAQDEETSEFFGKPSAAAESGAVDFVLPLGEVAGLLARLATSGERA